MLEPSTLAPIHRGAFTAYPRPQQPNGVQHFDIEASNKTMGRITSRPDATPDAPAPAPSYFVVTPTGVLRDPTTQRVLYYPTPEAAMDAFATATP